MTQSDLEKQLLQLPPSDKLRIVELLIKSLSSLWPKEVAQSSESESLSFNSANIQKSWPELIDSLAGAWPDFPSMAELRPDAEVDIPRESF